MSDVGSALLVTNLPPKCVIDDIKTAFKPFGVVSVVMTCDLSFRDRRYDLRCAYVFCRDELMLGLFENRSVEVMVRDYYVTVAVAEGSFLVDRSIVVTGLAEATIEDDITSALKVECVDVKIEEPGTRANDGFAFVTFSGEDARDIFLESFNGGLIRNVPVRVHPFPKPHVHCLVDVKLQASDFMRLRNNARFHDFKLLVPSGEINVSAFVLAMSSPVIARMIETCSKQKELALHHVGDYKEVIDALYGAPLSITPANCHFVHAVASSLLVNELIVNAGSVCYEMLTAENFVQECSRLTATNCDMRYIVEFIAARAGADKMPINNGIPENVIRMVATNMYMSSLSEQEMMTAYDGRVSPANIALSGSEDRDLNADRQLLINS